MNNLQKIGFFAGIAVAAVVGAYHMTPKGYTGTCAEAISPIKTKFASECAAMNDGSLHSGTLDAILTERDNALSVAKCTLGAEQWYCGRGNYSGPQAEYGMRVEKMGSCSGN